MNTTLPFVDEHQVTIAAPPAAVWEALRTYARKSLRFRSNSLAARVLHTEPAAGFAVVDERAGARLELAGRHRFSTYRLVFTLHEEGRDRVTVAARTEAAFPGALGRAYRALVIGSGAHRLVVRRMLRIVRRRALVR